MEVIYLLYGLVKPITKATTIPLDFLDLSFNEFTDRDGNKYFGCVEYANPLPDDVAEKCGLRYIEEKIHIF